MILINDSIARRLVCNAATLDERLFSQLDFISDSSNLSIKQLRMKRWRALVGAENDDIFQEIRGVKVNGDSLSEQLGRLDLLPGGNLPPWMQTLRTALKEIQQPFATNFKGDREALPFSQVLQPFVASASRAVKARSTTGMLAISPQAEADLQHMLLLNLCEVIAPSLLDHFSRYRIINNPLLVLRENFYDCAIGNEIYNLYVTHLKSGGLVQFFEEYPVAARAIAILMKHWIESVVEFLERLYHDMPSLLLMFGQFEAVVTSIQTGLSDPHNGGRSVFILTFAQGRRIVYKPRSIAPEIHFGIILERLKQIGLPTISIAPKVLDRGDYGWVEFIEHRDCTTKEDVSKYFENLGASLALLYSLGISDIHHENIIAHGVYPVFVDLETFLCPRPTAVDGNHDKGWDGFYSVQRVGLLPNEYVGKGEDLIDVGALGSKQKLIVKADFGEWQNINRDNMHLGEAKYVEVERKSLPCLSGEVFYCQDYVSEFISGFRYAYKVLIAAKQFILDHSDFLLPPDSCPIRFVLRDTALYKSLLHSSVHPQMMTTGVDRSIELERVYHTLVKNRRSELHKVIESEKNSLENFDIPYFWCMAGEKDLRTNQGVVACNFFAKSGIQVTRELIAHISEKDLEHQVSIIRASLFVSQIDDAHRSGAIQAGTSLGDVNNYQANYQAEPMGSNFLVETAHQIAVQICELAQERSSPNWKWIAPVLNERNGRYSVRLLGSRLYDGNSGIALFFCALAQISGEDTYRQIALDLLMPIRELLGTRHLPQWIREHGLGITTGFGSIIYSLVTAARLLSEKSLVTDALSGALLADTLPQPEQLLDVSQGYAGGILALLVLYHETRELRALQLATQYGEFLMAKIRTAGVESAVWGQRGIAHGVDGLCLALHRLSGASGEERFAKAARVALEYADTLGKHENQRSRLDLSWCWGIPGICLSKLASGDATIVGTSLEQDIQAIANAALRGADHVCCGSLGRIEFLLYSGQLLLRPKLIEIASELTLAVARRARERGAFHTPFPILHPGFFQGLAGIGYQLLRTGFPQQLPSILAFE